MKILDRRRRYFADSVYKVLNKNNLAIFIVLFHLYPDLRIPGWPGGAPRSENLQDSRKKTFGNTCDFGKNMYRTRKIHSEPDREQKHGSRRP